MRRGSGNGGCGWAGGVFGRWSLRRLLLESPLVGRRLAQTVLDQSEPKPSRVSAEQSHSRSHTTTIEFEVEDDESDTVECPLCLGTVEKGTLVRLEWCAHRCCETCLRQYLAIEICESRVPVTCPACHEGIHPTDVRRIVNNQFIFEKYEEFTVRRVLAADPDTRWCPAPDCNFAVVATGCASCPKLTCLAPGCGAMFCYHCKAAWHPTQTCDAARRDRDHEPRAQSSDHNEMEYGDVKPCPRCSVLIVKVEDGSCNHMVCCVCGAEFCWLCMKEVSDLHYLSPSGCTFWGKKPWSRKKKLLWQLGTLAGAPLGILVVAGVALPALLVGLPLWAGRRAHRRLRRAKPAKRRAAVAAAVTAALIVSPLVAGLAVGIGVPILLFYVYGVVPVSLCRAGGCADGDRPPHDPSIGDASLSASSETRAASTAALAGSLASASPAPTPAPPSPTPTTHTTHTPTHTIHTPTHTTQTPTHTPMHTTQTPTHTANTPPHKSNSNITRAALLRTIFLYGTYPLPPDVEAGILAGNFPPPPPEDTLDLSRSVSPQDENIEIDSK